MEKNKENGWTKDKEVGPPRITIVNDNYWIPHFPFCDENTVVRFIPSSNLYTTHLEFHISKNYGEISKPQFAIHSNYGVGLKTLAVNELM